MFPASTKSGGVHTTAGPIDTCKTPSPGGPIPVPYANMVDGLAASGDEAGKKTQKKMVDDAARKGRKAGSATAAAIASQGDEAGAVGGLISSVNMDSTSYTQSPFKVSFQGKGAPAGTQIAPSQSKVIVMGG